MTAFRNFSFAAGEITPSLYSRSDMTKYSTGLRTCRNWFVMRHGGATNRPGLSYVCEVKDSSKAVRLIPFIFSTTQTYVLEFGNLYMRVIYSGAQVTETGKTITGATQANPCQITATSHGFSNDQEVYISGVGGMSQLNGRNFKVAGATTHTFTLKYMDGTAVNSTAFTAFTSGGTAARVYTITTPYVEADLPELKFVQSADKVTIVHPSYAPRELARTAHTTWTLTAITFAPSISRPRDAGYTSSKAGASSLFYRVTAVSEETLEESLPCFGVDKPISAATQANPCAITTSLAHSFVTGDEVEINDVVGMTELNGNRYTITVTGAATFTLDGVNSTAYGAWVSGGEVAVTYIRIDATTIPDGTTPNVLAWTAVTGARQYNVYRSLEGIYGFIGTCTSVTFSDTGTDPDVTDVPPDDRDIFEEANEYPSAVTYYQQRLVFANTNNNTEGVWTSRSGYFHNFTRSYPIQDDDAITFTLVGRQVNEIHHLVESGILMPFTEGAEWTVNGDSAGVLTPSDVNARQQSYTGSSSRLAPIVIGNGVLYVQARGSIVRDIGYDQQTDGYRGTDRTVFAAHLFDGYTLSDWAYAQTPHSIVWAVRSDGTVLGLTYLPEHDVWAWHRHDFENGSAENVCVIPSGNEDQVYFVINRTIGGATKRYIEKMNTRILGDIEDAVFVDSALSYDGTNAAATTMTISGGTTWAFSELLTLTSSVGYFTSADVGNAIFLTGADGEEIRFTINAYTNTTTVTGFAHKTVPASLRTTATAVWAKAVDEVSGLWHLEGQTVSVFADGTVMANPTNANYTVKTVASGAITLDKPYAVIHVGLPITADLETLNLDIPQGETMATKAKAITSVGLFLEETRGLLVGKAPPSDDATDPLEGLTELKLRDTEGYDDTVALFTGVKATNISGNWNDNGRVFVRQIDPVPASVLAVVAEGYIPFRG